MAPVCLDHTSPLLVTHFFDVLHLPGSSALLYILVILHTEITNCLICDTHSFVVPLFWRAREELGHSTKIYLKDRTAQILRIQI